MNHDPLELQQELALIERAKQSAQAFTQLYRIYLPRIYKYCLYRLPTVETAEDVVGNVFMKAVAKIHNFDTAQGYRWGAWLFKVAHNEVNDYYRSNSRQIKEDFDRILDNEIDPNSDGGEHQVKAEFRRRRTAFVLSQIKPRYQQIITLKFYSQLETAEISVIMQIKPKQVHLVLHRALKAFRKEFLQNFDETEIFDLL